jgi:hypothetical protein
VWREEEEENYYDLLIEELEAKAEPVYLKEEKEETEFEVEYVETEETVKIGKSWS